MRASVIIATWNAADVLGRCLESVLRQELDGGFETIVVDNASTDGTSELLRGYAGRIRVIASDRNLRYSGANNLAAREARGGLLFFLNSDTELRGQDVLERLARAAEVPGVAIAGPRLVNPDGTLQPSCAGFPSVLRGLVVGLGLHRVAPERVLARVAPEFSAHDRPMLVDWVMGAAIAIRASTFCALGGFWPQLYLEEADIALRARRREHLRVRFEPAAEVMHVGNHSYSQTFSDAARARRVAISELVFLASHYGRARALAIRAVIGAGYAVRAALLLPLRRRRRSEIYRAMAAVYARGAGAP